MTFTAAAVNGGSAPFYQWKVNNVNVGTNDSVYTYFPLDGDIVKCQVTSNATCVGGNPAMSNQMIMIANTSLPVTISIYQHLYTTFVQVHLVDFYSYFYQWGSFACLSMEGQRCKCRYE